MGDRNHLHVCRHCGTVQATASATSPEQCVVCEAFTFSRYVPEPNRREEEDGDERATLVRRERVVE